MSVCRSHSIAIAELGQDLIGINDPVEGEEAEGRLTPTHKPTGRRSHHPAMLHNKRILLGITGSIAAYKSALARS